MMNNYSSYGNFRQVKFTDVFPSFEIFKEKYTSVKLELLQEKDMEQLYYLLYAYYGNSTIASSDTNQFIYKLFSIVFMYGPTWVKRLEVQKKLRDMSEEELLKGSKTIYNHANNPSTRPSTAALEELTYIDNQSTSNYVKSKLDGYSYLISLLETDVTKQFIDKFKKLFLTIVQPEEELWYGMKEMNI